MLLNVVVRTCVRTGVPTNKKRIVDDDRAVLVSKCIKSLADSCKQVKGMDIHVAILDDGSDAEYVDRFTSYFSELSFELIQLGGLGFNESAIKQFEWAKDHPSDFVYLVEDDYFHSSNAVQTIIDGYFFLRNFAPQYDTAIFPFDAPDRYFRDTPSPSIVLQHLSYHWRTMTHTSNTVFLRYQAFMMMYHLFHTLAKGYGTDPNIIEDTTINRMWSNLTSKHGHIVLWSPIPSLALHLSFEEIPEINTDLATWKTTWDNFSIEE
jgi:hypothetical protein